MKTFLIHFLCFEELGICPHSYSSLESSEISASWTAEQLLNADCIVSVVENELIKTAS
jgi:hypothetical protein